MAIFNMETSGDLPNFRKLYEACPDLSVRILGYIGKHASLELWENHVRGQHGITFRKFNLGKNGLPESKRGSRRMITYSVSRQYVRVSSFPLNFFEGGRTLPDGSREAPRRILHGALRSVVSSRLGAYIADAEKLIVEDWFEKAMKG